MVVLFIHLTHCTDTEGSNIWIASLPPLTTPSAPQLGVGVSMMPLCSAGIESFHQILRSLTGTWPTATGTPLSGAVFVYIYNMHRH